MKEDLPNLNVYIPSYPDWKKGLKWGIIWGTGWALLAVLIKLLIFDKVQLDAHNPSIWDEIFFWIGIFVFIFIPTCFIFGVLASFRPDFRK